jgi:hypothetical protein
LYQADRGLRDHFGVEKYMLDATFVACCEKLFREADRLIITSAHKPLPGEPIADAS